jgi:hypothetical protein
MADRDLDEFLSLVGDEVDAEGSRFWHCPRQIVAHLEWIDADGKRGVQRVKFPCPYVLTDDPSRIMGEPCMVCTRTDRSRCIGGACGYVHGGGACQASECGCVRV